ncbi:MAG: bifunctional diaminohydroxyphosphoribosylaminopyrimidine deaminase/5-amino-6-(5-phosphoribosylamino)uracil reductase RibD [Phycisphaerae bacterium]|nr:bifunctional diaminohydroxyphosphoribosylaminopyrimidine deaminase/5-amino-6-(5-phosphoribosylamino)uracil reductase RibD [Phycisphaerae bacterium]
MSGFGLGQRSGALDLRKRMLDLAAWAAARGAGLVEPNPLVGAVVARGERVLAIGHHRVFGGPHAEVEALRRCAELGHDPRGAEVYVTLEPCAHQGKTPPCVTEIVAAGIARVVIARADPNPIAAGGAALLRAAGVNVEFCGASVAACRLLDPFARAIRDGRPWTIAKWAQSIDGMVATTAGDSKWISSAASRRMVHRMRARVDAVLTGIGTARRDDPLLTARDVPVRRVARRVVIDPTLSIPESSRLVGSVGAAPLTVVCDVGAAPAAESRLRARGVEVVRFPAGPAGIEFERVLRHLRFVHGATNVLIEAGPGVLRRMFGAGLIDEAMVFVSPRLAGDGIPSMRGFNVGGGIEGWMTMELIGVRRVGTDAVMRLRSPSRSMPECQ